jgi:predicted AAA+ superfamily ATPase
MFKRNIERRALEALRESRVLLINGARQTGKTTLVRNLAAGGYDAEYVTLDDINLLSAARRDPVGFVGQFRKSVIIDEIQRAPELFLPIKMAVDTNPRPGSFMLTGSANVLTLPKLADSLAGRMEILSLWPLSQGEIEGVEENFIDLAFGETLTSPRCAAIDREALIERILKGGYPMALARDSEQSRKRWFDGYLTTLIERDVRDLSRVRDLAEFPRLLQSLATRTSALLNLNDISRTMAVQHETLRRYTALLEAMWLAVMLPAWSANLGRRLVRTPKITLNDVGLTAGLLGVNRKRLSREPFLLGQMLESFVVMELRKQSTWSETDVRLYHFRDHKGAEVDLVLETPAGEIVGVEVKAAATARAEDFTGLKTLQKLIGSRFRRGFLLHTGTAASLYSEGLYMLPISCLWRRHKL